jgi:alkylation response protein AidB-like acyl-CoA dehydrogenase
VQSADRAAHVLLWTSDYDCLLLVALDQPAVQVKARPTWDVTRRLFDLQLNKAALQEQTVLARGPAARVAIQRLQTLRDLALAADSIGGAAALLALTLEHLATRRQFGRPLALFQALKHRCADLKTQLAGAEALWQHSVAQIDDRPGDEGALDIGRKAKYLACATYLHVAEEALQFHGGIGMADEHPCHLFLKRAMLNEHLGSAQQGYEIAIADHFLGTA